MPKHAYILKDNIESRVNIYKNTGYNRNTNGPINVAYVFISKKISLITCWEDIKDLQTLERSFSTFLLLFLSSASLSCLLFRPPPQFFVSSPTFVFTRWLIECGISSITLDNRACGISVPFCRSIWYPTDG